MPSRWSSPTNPPEILFHQYADGFAPHAAEFGFVEEMAASDWRMRRLWAVETKKMAEAVRTNTAPEPFFGGTSARN